MQTAHGDGTRAETAAGQASEAAAVFGRENDVAEVEAIRGDLGATNAELASVQATFEGLLQRAMALAGGGSSTGSTGPSATRPTTRPVSAWSGHVGAPPVASIHVPEERRGHILDGDAFGGGHRQGTGIPGKSEFPARWSDESAVGYIMVSARAPDRVIYTPARGRRPEQWRCERECDGVTVVAIVRADGSVHTAWPLPGGRGVVDNPRGGQR